MLKVLKWIAIVIGGLAAIILLAVGIVYGLSNARLDHTYTVQVQTVPIPTDQASIAYGKHLASIHGCMACHGDNLAGEIEFQDPMVGVISNANLTTGRGSDVFDYTIEDWVRAIRHGIGPDGKPLVIMPAQTFYPMSDKDLGAIIAYVKSVPPVDNELPKLKLGVLPRVMFLAGQMDFAVPAEIIDHNAPRPPAPEQGVTADYGKYLAGLCTLCHGAGFSGGPIPGTPPSDPPALNLTPGGELVGWTFDDFLHAMRTGVTPGGRQLREEFMPYKSLFGDMTDDEWEAIWLYLQTLPRKDYGNR
jgi:mono/diheme cytochrome c family protein